MRTGRDGYALAASAAFALPCGAAQSNMHTASEQLKYLFLNTFYEYAVV